MAPEIWTIFLYHFLRNNRTILHAEQPENGCKRSYKRELKSGIIQCYKTCRRVNAVIEYPGSAAGSRRINDTFETIYYIPCCEQPAFPSGKSVVVMKRDIIAEMKSIHTPVI